MKFLRFPRWLGVELIEISAMEKIVSALGGALAILALTFFSLWALPHAGAVAVIASTGASAVLLFAVPHGALSQPWPVIGGHTISALIGVFCALYIPNPHIAVACAVGLSIGAMLQLKCVHPPGGATAFTAVMGGEAIHRLGFGFAFVPVLANAVTMVLLAVALNSFFPWRRYPSGLTRSTEVVPSRSPSHEEILAAVRSLESFVDITEEDLSRLIEFVESHREPSRHAESITSP